LIFKTAFFHNRHMANLDNFVKSKNDGLAKMKITRLRWIGGKVQIPEFFYGQFALPVKKA